VLLLRRLLGFSDAIAPIVAVEVATSVLLILKLKWAFIVWLKFSIVYRVPRIAAKPGPSNRVYQNLTNLAGPRGNTHCLEEDCGSRRWQLTLYRLIGCPLHERVPRRCGMRLESGRQEELQGNVVDVGH